MTPTLEGQLAIALLQLAFFAGVAWMIVRQTRRDVNGLGLKVRRMDEASEQRYFVFAIELLLAAPKEEQKGLAERLLRARRMQ